MLRLIRPAIVALLMCAASPVLAANGAAPATAQSEIATLKAQVAALKDQRDLEKRLVAVEAQFAQASRADARQSNLIALLAILIGVLGLLITAFLFVLTLRAPGEAREAARTVAANELTSARAEFTKLADEERNSVDESKQRLAEVNARADEIRELAASIKAMRDDADRHLSTIEAGAKAAEDAGRNATTDGPRRSEATEEQKQRIIAAVAESAGQTEEQWTVDQYKAAIGKALYADEDWQRGAELAQRLIDRHGTNRDALHFGLESLGRAEIGRRQWKEALDAYAALTADYETVGETETTDYCRAKHQQGYVLNVLGQPGQAEALYRTLVPIREHVNGTEDSRTLVARHNLAFAILDQDRAPEAEAMLRDLLPIRERVDGPKALGTLMTRCAWANALVQIGNLEGARAALAAIPDPVTNSNWLPRNEAGLAFVRGRVADAMGETQAADAQLARAAEIYASIFPEDNYERQKLKAYLDNRPVRKDARYA